MIKVMPRCMLYCCTIFKCLAAYSWQLYQHGVRVQPVGTEQELSLRDTEMVMVAAAEVTKSSFQQSEQRKRAGYQQHNLPVIGKKSDMHRLG